MQRRHTFWKRSSTNSLPRHVGSQMARIDMNVVSVLAQQIYHSWTDHRSAFRGLTGGLTLWPAYVEPPMLEIACRERVVAC